jgi:hypothetical protein
MDWLDIAHMLPQAANGCFKALISSGPAPGFGRLPPDADRTAVHRRVADPNRTDTADR